MTTPQDLLDQPLRALLDRLLAERQPPAPDGEWIDARCKQLPWRQLVAAAERGEVQLSRVGRKLLIRRAELDRWLAAQAIRPRERVQPAAAEPKASRVDHLLVSHGYTKAAAR